MPSTQGVAEHLARTICQLMVFMNEHSKVVQDRCDEKEQRVNWEGK